MISYNMIEEKINRKKIIVSPVPTTKQTTEYYEKTEHLKLGTKQIWYRHL